MARLSIASDDSVEKNPTRLSGIVPKTGSRIMYQLPGEIAFREAIALCRAGKAIRKREYWYNCSLVMKFNNNTYRYFNSECELAKLLDSELE